LVSSITDPAGVVQAAYTYDTAGRVSLITSPNPHNGKDGDVRNTLNTYKDYNLLDQVLHEWGDTDYPTEHVYDSLGRQTELHTFAKSSADFTQVNWPTAPSNSIKTIWAYEQATGFLLSKTDASNVPVSFTYTSAGQLYKKTNQRLQVTTYSYSPATGELTGESYSDGTQALGFTYNRLGLLATVTDDAGNRSLTYNDSGSTATFELQHEDFTVGDFLNQRLTYGIDSTTSGLKGRASEFDLGTASAPTSEQVVSYGYQSDGRLQKITAGADVFTYGYLSNSQLVQTISSTFGTNTYLDTRNYDPYHDWTKSRVTTFSAVSGPIASFTNTFDSIGQVASVAKSGVIYNVYGNGSEGLTTNYAYDDRAQIKGEQTKIGSSSTTLTGRDNGTYASPGFNYDQLGNRTTTAHNTSYTSTYTANNLNQYTNRTLPGEVDVALISTGSSAITISNTLNSSTDTLSGPTSNQYYFDSFNHFNNGTSGIYATLSASPTTPAASMTAYLPPSNFTITYDGDGNLTDDGRWTYKYNAKNQLTSVSTSAAAVAAGAPKVQYGYVYDYLGRRTKKVDYVWNTGTGSYAANGVEERYEYNGWNLAAVLDAGKNVIRTFVWGLDLSGTDQGAGGVGGLLEVRSGTNSFLSVFDTNGNLHGLITPNSVTIDSVPYNVGDLVATYEYDTFGNTIRESGAYATYNPFQFSTKFSDYETGLIYYGLRYYSPSLGRFINRDPVEEDGGVNLYGFCENNSVNSYDYLGLDQTFYTQYGYKYGNTNTWIPGRNWQAYATLADWDGGTTGGNIIASGHTLGGENINITQSSLGSVTFSFGGHVLTFNETPTLTPPPPKTPPPPPTDTPPPSLQPGPTFYSGNSSLGDLVKMGVLASGKNDATVVGSELYDATGYEFDDEIARHSAAIAYYSKLLEVYSAAGDEGQTRQALVNLHNQLQNTPGFILAGLLSTGPEFESEEVLEQEALRLFAGNRALFRGMEIRAVRDLSHLSDSTLMAMRENGFAPRTINGEGLSLHHMDQNPSGPVVEMPFKNNNVWNKIQHPLGTTLGAGLTEAERAAFNAWRVEYWKSRAAQELARRAARH
jgi:RHS repeat-associated protein